VYCSCRNVVCISMYNYVPWSRVRRVGELLRTQVLRQFVRPIFEYASFERTPLETEDLRMVEGVVELMGILLLTALTLLIGSCIVGSIVVALRAVGGGR